MTRFMLWASVSLLTCLIAALLVGQWLANYEQKSRREKLLTRVEEILLG